MKHVIWPEGPNSGKVKLEPMSAEWDENSKVPAVDVAKELGVKVEELDEKLKSANYPLVVVDDEKKSDKKERGEN